MNQKYNLRLITSRHSYTPDEIARLFTLHKKTVFRWIADGLHPLEKNTRPILIMGYELRRFLSKKKQVRKVKLKDDEYYCVKCRRASLAESGTESTVPTGKRIGKNAREQLSQQGKCVRCGTNMHRFL